MSTEWSVDGGSPFRRGGLERTSVDRSPFRCRREFVSTGSRLPLRLCERTRILRRRSSLAFRSVCPTYYLFSITHSPRYIIHTNLFTSLGGDDRRVVLWNFGKTLLQQGQPEQMSSQHLSNIFCLAITKDNSRIFSGGNDDQVMVHDSNT